MSVKQRSKSCVAGILWILISCTLTEIDGLVENEGMVVGVGQREVVRKEPKEIDNLSFSRRLKQSENNTSNEDIIVEGDSIEISEILNSTDVGNMTAGETLEVIPVPVPGSSPEEESPFATDRRYVCCCKTTSGRLVTVPYQENLPSPECCCGSYSQCCRKTENLTSLICGGGHGCGVLLLVLSLVGVILLGICLSGTFLLRRRRRRRLLNQESSPRAAAIRAMSLDISEDQVSALEIKDLKEELIGQKLECPICLETKQVTQKSWKSLPCSHGACKPCLDRLMRDASKSVSCDSSKLAIFCPLCRKPAIFKRTASENRENDVDRNCSSQSDVARDQS